MLSMTREEADAYVAKAAAHLDRVSPTWFAKINVDTLDISHASHCICGQLAPFGDWSAEPVGSLIRDGNSAALYSDRLADYRILQDAWIAAIADRRLAAEVAAPALVAVSA